MGDGAHKANLVYHQPQILGFGLGAPDNRHGSGNFLEVKVNDDTPSAYHVHLGSRCSLDDRSVGSVANFVDQVNVTDVSCFPAAPADFGCFSEASKPPDESFYL